MRVVSGLTDYKIGSNHETVFYLEGRHPKLLG